MCRHEQPFKSSLVQNVDSASANALPWTDVVCGLTDSSLFSTIAQPQHEGGGDRGQRGKEGAG
eukprot:3941085-Rhodomonas_salina.1